MFVLLIVSMIENKKAFIVKRSYTSLIALNYLAELMITFVHWLLFVCIIYLNL